MKICPEARLDDGALDLVTVGDFSKGEILTNLGRLYEGTHIELEAVEHARVTRVAAEPVRYLRLPNARRLYREIRPPDDSGKSRGDTGVDGARWLSGQPGCRLRRLPHAARERLLAGR